MSLAVEPGDGAGVVEDVGVVAAAHREGEERVGDGLEADAAAEVGVEGEAWRRWCWCWRLVGRRSLVRTMRWTLGSLGRRKKEAHV